MCPNFGRINGGNAKKMITRLRGLPPSHSKDWNLDGPLLSYSTENWNGLRARARWPMPYIASLLPSLWAVSAIKAGGAARTEGGKERGYRASATGHRPSGSCVGSFRVPYSTVCPKVPLDYLGTPFLSYRWLDPKTLWPTGSPCWWIWFGIWCGMIAPKPTLVIWDYFQTWFWT